MVTGDALLTAIHVAKQVRTTTTHHHVIQATTAYKQNEMSIYTAGWPTSS